MNKISHDSETPAHGQQVITACAFIHHNFNGVPKVFLPKRAGTKKFLPGVFEMPGGHIEFGEDIEVGLKREVHEELGKDVVLGDPFAVFSYVNEIKGSHSVEIIYMAQWVGGINDIQLNPEDHSEYTWFSEEELLREKGAQLLKPLKEKDPEYIAILKGFEMLRKSA
jgi:8-oxo-dGTP diphosphatase